MDKKAIKEFAVWARKKLISDITKRAAHYGIKESGISEPLPQSTAQVQLFDIGAKEPVVIQGREIVMRHALVKKIREKEKTADCGAAFRSVMEEISYTWFNRLTAVRFMEASGYLPSGTRVLSSEARDKLEPDIVTRPFETDLDFSDAEREFVWKLKDENRLNELFRLLFIKQCNKQSEILPGLFEKSDDYSELLLDISFSDKEGLVYRLTHDIAEEDFNAEKGGQVEIIGWLYQFYNSEPYNETKALLKKDVKITKERLPAATQFFTPDWIVRYMAENSLGRLWLEGHPNETLKSEWKYYLDEAEQEPEIAERLASLREKYKNVRPEEIKIIDPCMGSGHILVYAFDLLMRIYESEGWNHRDAVQSILKNNLYGLDIDDRAAQLAYFAVMMKARQYDRRIFSRGVQPNVYSLIDSVSVAEVYHDIMKDFSLTEEHMETLNYLLKVFADAKEYGSIIKLEKRDYRGLAITWQALSKSANVSLWHETIKKTVSQLIKQAVMLTQEYDIVITNPPYAGAKGLNLKLKNFLSTNYKDGKFDIFAAFIQKCLEFMSDRGKISLITPNTLLFNPSYTSLRKQIATTIDINGLIELGEDAFGVGLGTVVYSCQRKIIGGYIGKYFDVSKDIDKTMFKKTTIYNSSVEYFLSYDNFKYQYKLNNNYRSILNKSNKLLTYGTPRIGLQTSNNNKFTREWYEIDNSKLCCTYNGLGNFPAKKWFPMVKGGGYRKWYGNITCVVNWENNGADIKTANINAAGGRIVAEEYYFRSGLTWTHTTYSQPFSMRYMPTGAIINVEGPGIFDLSEKEPYVLACLNSVVSSCIFEKIVSSIHYSAGELGQFPILLDNTQNIAARANYCIKLSQIDWDSFETSWDFKTHPFITHNRDSRLENAFKSWQDFAEKQFYQLKANEEELNRIFIDIYGLNDELTPEVEEKDVTVRRADLVRDVKSLISYAVGCIFGRYSLDCEGLAYAGGEWEESKYRRFTPDKDNCLPITDEEYFLDDAVSLFCKWLAAAFGEKTLEENLDFVARALGGSGSSRRVIRNYFIKDFFKDHCKIYQKRPIYWLFDSGKENGFKALVYMHRWNADTIGNLRVEYLHPLQVKYENQIALKQQILAAAKEAREKTAVAKEMEKLKKQLKEIRDYDTKIAHLALSRIAIDLDDGVKTNYEKVQTARDGNKLEVLAKI